MCRIARRYRKENMVLQGCQHNGTKQKMRVAIPRHVVVNVGFCGLLFPEFVCRINRDKHS